MADRVSAASFIGRERELTELATALADARAGDPRLVFVAGESGVGKSRLLSEFERRASELGSRTIGGECVELGEDELPYAPLVAAMRPLARDADAAFEELSPATRAELVRLAPELGEPAPERVEDREGEAQRRLFDSVLALLERLGRDDPVIFWLEDLHWADRSTRSFLAFLASSLRDERVLAIATYRSDELHRRHPLRPLLTELERGPGARRLELAPFDRAELEAQLADILGGPPSGEVVERLFARSEGNALFTEELLAAGLDGRAALPPTLRDALLSRLERQAPDSRRVLGLLAVAGRATDTTLADAGGFDPAQLRGALRDALAANLIRTDETDRFAFRHALLREVLYDDLLPGERSELHLALARTLAARAATDPGAWSSTAIAHHFHRAGEQTEALRASVAAAGESERISAHGEAAALLDRALGLWPRVAKAEQLAGCDLAGLLARAARAHYLGADDARAEALLAQAIETLDPDTEPRRVARLLGDFADVQWSLGQAQRSRDALERALALLPDEPTEEGARLLAHQIRFKFLQGRFAEVEEIGGRAIEMCEVLGLEDVKSGVLNRFGCSLFQLGEVERGERLIRESVELARSSGTNDEIATVYLNWGDILNGAGRSEDATRVAARAASEIEGGDRSAGWLAVLRAEIAFARGNWRAAADLLPDPRSLAYGNSRVTLNIARAGLALGRGDTGAARPLLEESQDMLAGSVEPQYISGTAALLAELELRERRIDAARDVIERALDRLQYCTEDSSRIAQVATVGVAVEAAAAERCRDLGDEAGGGDALARLELMLGHSESAVEDSPGPVERALLADARAAAATGRADAAAAERWREAAEAWAKLPRPYPRARAAWRRAEALAVADERDEAARAASEGLEIARGLGASWLIAELESLGARARLDLAAPGAQPAGDVDGRPEDPFGLTERERQVLELVAAGATNREIAGELFMAEKTASVHVSRILGKLGVRSRTEAAAIAHRQGLAGTADSPQ